MGTIYVLENKIDGKRYVGQTINWAIRSAAHRRGDGVCPINRAIRKHGFDCFRVWHFDNIPEDQLDIFERAYIASFGSLVPNGYNLESGGNAQKRHHDETRKKMSESRRGEKNSMFGRTGEKSPHFGKHLSDETKRKISDSRTGEKHWMHGRHLSEEHRQKISAALTGERNHFFGRHHSEESRHKNAEAHMGAKNVRFGKPGWRAMREIKLGR